MADTKALERRELLRIAAARALALDAQIKHLTPEQRREAMRAANVKPLSRAGAFCNEHQSAGTGQMPVC